ncbi:Histone-lysine N-methyltransferase EZA1, partial [Linum perenne]
VHSPSDDHPRLSLLFLHQFPNCLSSSRCLFTIYLLSRPSSLVSCSYSVGKHAYFLRPPFPHSSFPLFLEQEIPARTRVFRRKGKAHRFKYSRKSSGHPSSMRKRIADERDELCKQYTPCGCQPTCGTQCPCLKNGTCCEKYCGCSKSCKNRFRGCHCAKGQCRSRLCPCFAADRECDPDVCRNCWVSCGDGSLGEPPKRGDGQCVNMRLLLRQQQRIILAKSDVTGWGAFLKNSVNKNDFLGEYTGEVISHREADKRGKIYDRANSSFLFNLNDQSVLDANRKGDKLKFANHSLNPNCYAHLRIFICYNNSPSYLKSTIFYFQI